MNCTCPSCSKALTIPDRFAGSTAQCPACGAKFTAMAPIARPVPVEPMDDAAESWHFRALGIGVYVLLAIVGLKWATDMIGFLFYLPSLGVEYLGQAIGIMTIDAAAIAGLLLVLVLLDVARDVRSIKELLAKR